MDADIRIDVDEQGFWLVVKSENIERLLNIESQQFLIEDPEAFYDHVRAAILPWLMERDQARRSPFPSPRMVEIGAGESGYDLSDPKHPDFHSVHADIWDAREGK